MLGSDRLNKAVGKNEAENVQIALDAKRTETWVVTTRRDGSTEIEVLDGYGKAKNIGTSKLLSTIINSTGAEL